MFKEVYDKTIASVENDGFLTDGVKETLQHMETTRREFESTRVALGIFKRSLALQHRHMDVDMASLRAERAAILPPRIATEGRQRFCRARASASRSTSTAVREPRSTIAA